MAFDLVVDRRPVVGLSGGGLFAQASKAGDVIRPVRFARMRNFRVIALGLLECPDVMAVIGLLRARGDRPCEERAAEKRDEIAPSHGGSGSGNCVGSKSWSPLPSGRFKRSTAKTAYCAVSPPSSVS